MDKKKLLLSILGIFVLVLATVGVTFAVFTYTKLGTTENVVTTGTLKFLYTENTGVGNGINISDALPVSDEVGKSYSTENYVFDFSVEATNSGAEEIPYEITLRKKSTSTLNESNVKVYLTDMTEQTDTKLAGPILYSDLGQTIVDVGDEIEKTIYNGAVLGGELNYKKDFRLRMWIDEASNYDSISGKTFTVLVNVYSNTKVVTDGPVYYDINSVLNSYDESELKETVMCSSIKNGDITRYYDCGIYDTIEESLASRDKGTIILTSDINRDNYISISASKDIVLEFNGKNITTSRGIAVQVNGKLNILNNSNNESLITSPGTTISNNINASLEVSNVKVISTNESNASAICNNGNLIVNDNSYVEGVYGIGCHNSDSSSTIVNGGTIIGTTYQGIQQNVDYKSKVVINDGYIKGNNIGISNNGLSTTLVNNGTIIGETTTGIYNAYSGNIDINGGNITGGSYGIYNGRTGTINVYAGVVTGLTSSAIYNIGDGIINIIQKDEPLYITSLAKTWLPAVRNAAAGTINISGNEADICTDSSSDTTNGLCIYAEGDKNYESNTANTAIANTGEAGGIININGGTMYGGQSAINNHFGGTINIKNGKVLSSNFAIYNIRDGIINICNAKISAPNYDFYLGSDYTGTINYSTNVIFTSGNNTPVIFRTGNVIPNYTGTCDTE